MFVVVPYSSGWRTCVFPLVDLTPCVVCYIFPFWVSSASGKYLFLTLIVNPVHVVKFPSLTLLSHVDFFGNPSHACRYLIACSVLGNSYSLLMDWLGSGRLSIMVSTFLFPTLCFSVTLHSPPVFHIHPVNISCPGDFGFNSLPS